MGPKGSASYEGKQTMLLIGGAIAAVVIVAILTSLFVSKPWQSDEYKECVSTLEQLNGGEDVPDSVVDLECGPYE
jgi:hypothetical protein